MEINGIPSIYIERIDVMLLVRSDRIFGRRLPSHLLRMSKGFLALALQLPEIATMTHLRTQSHSWLN